MGQLFMEGGVFMWPLLLLAVVVVILSVSKIVGLFGATRPEVSTHEINTILFCGGFSLIVGFLGHYLGIYGAMKAVAMAGDVSPAAMAAGYGVSLITILFGMLIFLFSALMWFLLRWRFMKQS